VAGSAMEGPVEKPNATGTEAPKFTTPDKGVYGPVIETPPGGGGSSSGGGGNPDGPGGLGPVIETGPGGSGNSSGPTSSQNQGANTTVTESGPTATNNTYGTAPQNTSSTGGINTNSGGGAGTANATGGNNAYISTSSGNEPVFGGGSTVTTEPNTGQGGGNAIAQTNMPQMQQVSVTTGNRIFISPISGKTMVNIDIYLSGENVPNKVIATLENGKWTYKMANESPMPAEVQTELTKSKVNIEGTAANQIKGNSTVTNIKTGTEPVKTGTGISTVTTPQVDPLINYKGIQGQLPAVQKTLGTLKYTRFENYLNTLPQAVMNTLNGQPELIAPLSKKFVSDPVWANQLRGDGVTGNVALLSDLGIPIKPVQTSVDVVKPVGEDVVTSGTLPELYKVAQPDGIVIYKGGRTFRKGTDGKFYEKNGSVWEEMENVKTLDEFETLIGDNLNNIPSRVSAPGGRADKYRAYSAKELVPDKYRNDPRFDDLSRDPAHQGVNEISAASRGEAMAGLEAESQGLIEGPIERGPKEIEFYDKNGDPWDVKAPPSAKPGQRDFFDAEVSGNSIKKELTEKGNPPGTFPNKYTGLPVKKRIILDSSYMNEKDYDALWKWLNENLSGDDLKRIVEINTEH
jgi:hypothetical protein